MQRPARWFCLIIKGGSFKISTYFKSSLCLPFPSLSPSSRGSWRWYYKVSLKMGKGKRGYFKMEGENKEFMLNLRLVFRKNKLKICMLIPLKRNPLECCLTQIKDCFLKRDFCRSCLWLHKIFKQDHTSVFPSSDNSWYPWCHMTFQVFWSLQFLYSLIWKFYSKFECFFKCHREPINLLTKGLCGKAVFLEDECGHIMYVGYEEKKVGRSVRKLLYLTLRAITRTWNKV